jgi:hypothetical protein
MVWIENKILTLNSSLACKNKKSGSYATVFYLQAPYSCLRPVCVLVQPANLCLHQFLTLPLWSSQHSPPTNNYFDSITGHSISLLLPSRDTISKCTIHIGLHSQSVPYTRTKQAGGEVVSTFLRAHRNFERRNRVLSSCIRTISYIIYYVLWRYNYII